VLVVWQGGVEGIVEYGYGFIEGDPVLFEIGGGFGWVKLECESLGCHAAVVRRLAAEPVIDGTTPKVCTSEDVSWCVSMAKSSSLLDTRVVYCGDNLEQLKKLPDACIDLIYIDPPFNSNRNYEVFWGETKEKRSFEDRHESTQAYIEFMRPRCVELARVLKKAGSFYYHCDWHASHYVKVILDQIMGENFFQARSYGSAHPHTRTRAALDTSQIRFSFIRSPTTIPGTGR
jgi:hypothetical protein